MVFSSTTFLFLFLPLTLIASLLAGKRFRNHVLLAASLFFYFWGEGIYTLLLLFCILTTFVSGKMVSRHGAAGKPALILGITLNLIPLFLCKYLEFFIQIANQILAIASISPIPSVRVHLPAGISFFTFQAISYLIDVHRQVVPAEKKLLNCGLYIAMFPQLIAGPIVRYQDIARELVQRTINRAGFAEGAERFVFGLAKKVLLADPLGVKADKIFALSAPSLAPGEAWLGAICFSLQIYYDFSGYSDMAIGLGRMFGFHLPENFNYPYISSSMREFWRRWHISLSTWLRDYLYIPLGGNRKGQLRTMINLLIVFLLCGLWHGANWTFLVWGLWHGLFLVGERLFPWQQNTWPRRLAGWLYTQGAVLLGWVIFRSTTLAGAWEFIETMFTPAKWPDDLFWQYLTADPMLLAELIFGIAISLPAFAWLRRQVQSPLQETENAPAGSCFALQLIFASLFRLALFGTLVYFSLITIAARAYHPFLYFQF